MGFSSDLLIDATNLSSGGGGVLLRTLVGALACDYRVLLSSNARPALEEAGLVDSRIVKTPPCQPLSRNRDRLLRRAIEDFGPKRLLCFGNVPPKTKFGSVEVITYFQNAHLLSSLDFRTRYRLKDRARYALLRTAVRRYARNTDYWAVQTPFIGDALCRELSVDREQAKVFPFYDDSGLEELIRGLKSTDRGKASFVYVSDDRPHKNHRRLLAAWDKVAVQFPKANLSLTIDRPAWYQGDDENVRFLGPVSWEQSVLLAGQSEYVVFPSLLETIGLGVVEGVKAGCKALVPTDERFRHIVKPSGTFDPLSVDSIRGAMVKALTDAECAPSELVIENRLTEFTDWLVH